MSVYRVRHWDDGAGRISAVSVAARRSTVVPLRQSVPRRRNRSARRLLLLPDVLRLQVAPSTLQIYSFHSYI